MATGKRGRLGIRHRDVYSLGQEPSDRVKSNVQLGHTRFDLIKKQDFSILLQFHRPNVCFTSSYLDSRCSSISFYLQRNFPVFALYRVLSYPCFQLLFRENWKVLCKWRRTRRRKRATSTPISSIVKSVKTARAKETSSQPSIFSCCSSGCCPI